MIAAMLWGSNTHALEVINLNDHSESLRLGDFVEVLEDPSRSLKFDDIQSPESDALFVPVTHNDLNFGFTTSDYWVRFRLDTKAKEDWLLEVAYPLLDILEFYVPRPYGGYIIKRTGDKLPFSTREISYNNFVFNIPHRQDGAHTYYLHVESEGAAQIPLVLWPEKEFNQHVLQERIGFGVYYGIIFVMGLYNLFLFLFVRDRNYLYYVIYIATYGTMQLSLNGLAFEYLWPNHPWWGSYSPVIFVGIGSIAIFMFTRSFLNASSNAPLCDRLMFYLIFACAAAILTAVFIDFVVGAKLTTLLAIVLGIVVLIASIRALLKGYRPARYFLLAWVGFLLGIVVNALLYIGFLPNNAFTGYAMQVGSVLEAILFSLAIADRILLLQQEKHEVERLARRHLSNLNEDLEESVQTRTQELMAEKEKVEAVNLALEKTNKKLSMLASMDAMTELLNHRAFMDRLETELSEAYRYKYPLSLIMLDLDYFKKVNDEYGHQMGDEVLNRVADILKGELRQSDIGGRYGGEEFVLLLPHSTEEDADQIAERVRAKISKLKVPGKPGLRITASLGIASIDPKQPEVECCQLVSMADKALYHAKEKGRDRVSLYQLVFAK